MTKYTNNNRDANLQPEKYGRSVAKTGRKQGKFLKSKIRVEKADKTAKVVCFNVSAYCFTSLHLPHETEISVQHMVENEHECYWLHHKMKPRTILIEIFSQLLLILLFTMMLLIWWSAENLCSRSNDSIKAYRNTGNCCQTYLIVPVL